ncbi:hypothetical protein C8T65DRAFT_662088 [Cerioporus squamosus]|nr:hypothetical protein C8T65DRAFT_662088 [Cerioporus squamosus]
MRGGSCEVWFTCEDQRLSEYSVGTSQENTFTCFVPSEAGKEFKIHGKNDYDESIALSIAFDGSKATSLAIDPGKTNERWGIRTSPAAQCPFQFSELVTVDDDDALQYDDNANLGTVRVRVYRMRWKSPERSQDRHISAFKATGRVHERSKKAGTHCVALGDPVTVVPRSSRYQSTSEYIDKSPLVTFVFRYRPLALLQAQEIAPLSPSNGLPSQPSTAGPEVESSQSQLQAASPSQSQGGASQSQPDPSRQRAEREAADRHVRESSRPAKRPRIGSEDAETKPDVDTLSDDEDELDSLKSNASALQGQLQQLMSKIDRMESKRTRKAAGSRMVPKKEEPSDVGFVSGEVIDLTLSD